MRLVKGKNNMIGNRKEFFKIKGVIFIIVAMLLASFTWRNEQSIVGFSPLSPTAFVVDTLHNQLIVAQKTGLRIDFIDLQTGEIKQSIPTPLPPTGICFDGKEQVFVTCSHSMGEVLVVDVINPRIVKRWEAGHGAICPVLSTDGTQLYVANQYTDDVSVYDLQTNLELARMKVLRQPMAMDVTPDGRWLYVANFLPATRADLDIVAADVSIIDLENQQVIKHIKLSNGSNALRGLKVTPDGNYVLIAHNLGRFQVPTTQLEQGWMYTSALSIIDTDTQSLLATILLDEPEYGAAGSWGVDANEAYIAVAHSGTHDYSLIDYQGMIEKLSTIADKEVLSYDLTFLTGLRQRYPIEGNGPRAIGLSEGKVYSALYFSDRFQIDEVATKRNSRIIAMNPTLKMDSARLGEVIFNDATHCFQQWQSCNGCHPNEARTDGLNWDLLNDGIGNPKNCKSMVLSHETPPAMITGIRPSAEVAVRAGFRHIQFAQVEESQARAVDYYLRSLQPVPSPYLVKSELSAKAQKGKMVYERIGCGYCHPAPYYADGKKHQMGTPGPADRTTEWDTPTLCEVWRTAPYLHDGRAATMEEVLKIEKHGLQKELSNDELEQLIEYVLSL